MLVVLTAQWWLLAVGAASIAAAWLYTGGPRPYGYAGLGEVFVFVFFGLVPVVGTAYVQTLAITAADVVASIGVGLLACAILVTNNLRDIAGDTVAGKITLAVRLGDARTRRLYAVIVVVAILVPLAVAALTSPWVAATCLTGILAIRPVRVVLGGATGPGADPGAEADRGATACLRPRARRPSRPRLSPGTLSPSPDTSAGRGAAAGSSSTSSARAEASIRSLMRPKKPAATAAARAALAVEHQQADGPGHEQRRDDRQQAVDRGEQLDGQPHGGEQRDPQDRVHDDGQGLRTSGGRHANTVRRSTRTPGVRARAA